MTLSELMNGVTPSGTYAGYATNDDFILAIDTEGSAINPSTYDIVGNGITNCEGSVNADTNDVQYIRTGKVTSRSGAQRAFKIEGERLVGDKFQDWLLSFATQFGKGAAAERKYVYFNMLTGKGETGTLMFNVSDTQTGDPLNRAGFSADASSVGTPTEYTYAAA